VVIVMYYAIFVTAVLYSILYDEAFNLDCGG